MSHFSTLVVIEKAMEMDPKEIPNELERRLAPFMENCCGEPDKMYMKFYDQEDEFLKEYENGEGREMVVMPDGRLLLPWADEFRKEFKEGDNPLERFAQPKAPDHLPRKVVPFKETYSTFEEFVKEWHGYKERDETLRRYGYWQNPNAKWDWYEVGGRWAGFFQLKPGHTGGLGKQYNFGSIKESKGRADIAFKIAIDWETMRRQKEEKAAKEYDAVWAAIKGTPEAESWEEVKSDFNLKDDNHQIDEARKKYHGQPRVKALHAFSMTEEGREIVGFFTEVEAYQIPREQFLQRARNNAGIPFAIVKDGKWLEHGEMGWFGVVGNEKDPETWTAMAAKMIDELPEDTLLVLVDCHI